MDNVLFLKSFWLNRILQCGRLMFNSDPHYKLWESSLPDGRILAASVLRGWQLRTKIWRDTKERWAVKWSFIVLAHYGVLQWGTSHFVPSQGQCLKARAMEGISAWIYNLTKSKGAFRQKERENDGDVETANGFHISNMNCSRTNFLLFGVVGKNGNHNSCLDWVIDFSKTWPSKNVSLLQLFSLQVQFRSVHVPSD